MRLGTLSRGGAGSVAIAIDEAGAHPIEGFADVGALLRDPAGLDAAAAALDGAAAEPFEEAQLLRPVLEPGAVICVGLNYRNHILEMGRELPTDPTLFGKLPRALTDPFAELAVPVTKRLDYEAELGVVIGTAGRAIDAADAWSHVAGVCVVNDVTARDFQKRTVQWFAGKNFQESTPWGPWIVTPEEFGEVAGHELSLRVNGEERQRADLAELVFGVPELIADMSRIFELRPGDLIATGTPGGVGQASERFLAPGDVVEVEIDGIGKIRSTIAEGRL
jgi:acylpyruvate hydrolase